MIFVILLIVDIKANFVRTFELLLSFVERILLSFESFLANFVYESGIKMTFTHNITWLNLLID
mgnify:FL=1